MYHQSQKCIQIFMCSKRLEVASNRISGRTVNESSRARASKRTRLHIQA